MSSKIKIAKICDQCATRFIAKTTVTRFCSKACNSKFYKTTARNAKLLNAKIDTITRQTEIKTAQIERHYLNVNEVADLLGVSKRSVYGMINSGRLNALNLSVRSTRVSRIDLEVFFFNNGIKSNLINTVEPIAKSDKQINVADLKVGDCYSMDELVSIFDKSRTALYTALARASVPKIKIGKEAYFEKVAVGKLLKKYKMPKQLGLSKERTENQKLSEQGLKASQCYGIEDCVKMFGKDRSLLYGIFNRRLVPKIRDGQNVLLSRKAIDKLYKTFKREGRI
ncbi:MAG: DNA-binding protein [Pedobacter sp.]|nr:MAG: DNA-binding protein [Pedobacter sp.]